ncbi:MAG: cache domain-containing protein [Clostridium sp.]
MTAEDWFTDTLERTENLHFTTPHVQYIFDSDENQYTWVITMTRAVEITKGVSAEQGILLIDITYGSLKQLLDSITMGNHGYLYPGESGRTADLPPADAADRRGADAGKFPGCCRLPRWQLPGVLSGRDPGCDGQIGGLYRLEAGGRYT